MPAIYQYFYSLGPTGTHVSTYFDQFTRLEVLSDLEIGDTGKIKAYGPSLSSTLGGPYDGFSQNGDIYLQNQFTGDILFISNTLYSVGAPVPPPTLNEPSILFWPAS